MQYFINKLYILKGLKKQH